MQLADCREAEDKVLAANPERNDTSRIKNASQSIAGSAAMQKQAVWNVQAPIVYVGNPVPVQVTFGQTGSLV